MKIDIFGERLFSSSEKANTSNYKVIPSIHISYEKENQ